ncbi:hypothetical protein LFZ31_15580 [Salmonella enterica subsp. enterica serovar Newport str. S09097]|nr:hypothetical protein LFZ31_15580 [Salmonella enterica subsp. enterica serovar Newport str. S09097]
MVLTHGLKTYTAHANAQPPQAKPVPINRSKAIPDAPWETAVQVGNGAQPEDQTLHDKEHTQDD